MTYHTDWAEAGKNVAPGSPGWYRAFASPWAPAPPLPATSTSPVGILIADMLTNLRAERRGSPTRQAATPYLARKRRKGEVTLTEYGSSRGLGARQVRKALLDIGLLQLEVRSRVLPNGAPDYSRIPRLSTTAVTQGLGRRLSPRTGPEFDVLTTKGAAWVDARLREAGMPPMSRRGATRETIRTLIDEGQTASEIVRITGMSKQAVSYHMRKLATAKSNETLSSLLIENPYLGVVDQTGISGRQRSSPSNVTNMR